MKNSTNRLNGESIITTVVKVMFSVNVCHFYRNLKTGTLLILSETSHRDLKFGQNLSKFKYKNKIIRLDYVCGIRSSLLEYDILSSSEHSSHSYFSSSLIISG